jgi:hypothetical protein
LIANAARVVVLSEVSLLLADVSPNLINFDTAAGQIAHLLVHQLCATVADLDEKPTDRIAMRSVIRSVLRIELPSTKQLMIWMRRASGTRFMGLPLNICMQYD